MDEKKILIVEDERDCLQTIAAELRFSGYKVVSASDGCEAVTVARQEKPDLVLLDIGLPAGGGIFVMKRMAAINTLALTPIIIITASDSETIKKLAFENGAAAYFQKPFDLNELLESIQNALRGSKPVHSG